MIRMNWLKGRAPLLNLLLVVGLLAALVLPVIASPQEALAAEPQGLNAHTKKVIEEQGHNINDVVLLEDFNTDHPYGQVFKNTVTNERILVVSGLPGVNHLGQEIIVAWDELEAGKKYKTETNTFEAEFDEGRTTLRVINDQPDGRNAWDELVYDPQLFLNGNEVRGPPDEPEPYLLGIDPINDYYYNNVIEWDYDIAKRYTRVIEGRLLSYWIFDSNPGGDVLIRYNQVGSFYLSLGEFKTSYDTEEISSEYFDQAEYPLVIRDSTTFYPGGDPSGMDGYIGQITVAGDTWTNLRGAAGTTCSPLGTNTFNLYLRSTTSNNKYDVIYRGAFLFDTSSLGDTVEVTAATFSVRGQNKSAGGSAFGAGNQNVYTLDPADPTDLVAADFATYNATALSGASISYASWDTAGYNDWALNADGLAVITVRGITKLGTREVEHDAVGGEPSWSSESWVATMAWYVEKGAGYQPKLAVTYSIPEGAGSYDFYSTVSDGRIQSFDAVYFTCHDDTAGDTADHIQDYEDAGQEQAGANYYVNRIYLYFDTSSLDDAAVIQTAKLYIYGRNVSEPDAGTADLNIFEGTQSTPLVVGDFDEFGAVLLTDGDFSYEYPISIVGYTEATLNAAGRATIDKTGVTLFCLITEGDKDRVAPGAGNSNRQQIWSTEKGTVYRPKLVITTEGGGEPTAPTVSTVSVSEITSTSAKLKGEVTNVGGSAVTIRGFDVGLSSGQPYFYEVKETGSWGAPAEFELTIYGLPEGGTRYYVAKAFSDTWGYGSEETFVTLPDPPDTLVATPGAGEIDLTWNKGDGATNTIIRGKIGGYPANYDTDVDIYSSTGTSTTHEGIDAEDTWYYRAWSEKDGSYSSSYAQATTTPAEFYTIGYLPDTQFYSETYPATFTLQTEWLRDIESDENVVHTIHIGDIVDNPDVALEWTRSVTSMDILKDGGLSYSMVGGNHDEYPFSSNNYDIMNTYYPYTDFPGSPNRGYWENGTESSWMEFSLGGDDFLLLNIAYYRYNFPTGFADWANAVITANPDRMVIIATHSYLYGSDEHIALYGNLTSRGERIWDNIASLHSNVVLILSGHRGEERYHHTQEGVYGNTVHSVLACYQLEPNGGNGWMRLYKYYPDTNLVRVRTYSPLLASWDETAEEHFEFYLGWGPSTQAATGIGDTTATLHGTLINDGGESCSLRFAYGLDTSYGYTTAWDSPYTTGDPYSDNIASLLENSLYHFRIEAKHADETMAYGGDLTFLTTGGVPGAPTSFSASPTTSTIVLGWIKGDGATNTLIRYSADTYPTTVTSGSSVYWDDGTSYIHSAGLVPGILYYYSAFGETDGVYSATYATASAMLGTEPGPGELPLPELTSMEAVKIFDDFLEPGDILIVGAYRVIYDITPSADIKEYFAFQLLDGDTIKAQGVPPQWGYRPISLYRSASSLVHNPLIWGYEYTAKIAGRDYKWDTPPEAEYAISGGSWIRDDLTILDTWVLDTAERLEDYYGVILIDYTPGYGRSLNTQGGDIFNRAIPGLRESRPHLFSAYIVEWNLDDAEKELTYLESINLTTTWGEETAGYFDQLGSYMGDIDGEVAAAGGGVILFFVVVGGLSAGVVGAAGALMAGIPLLLMIGFLVPGMLGVLIIFAALGILYMVWMTVVQGV